MTGRGRGGAAGLAVLALGWVGGTRLAAVDPRQSYLDGVAALRRGDGAAAAALLERAATARPVEQARARLVGVIPEPYLPHHYLGLAYAALGRCEEALRAWQRSAEQGAVDQLPASAAEARAGIAECRRRLGIAEPGEQAAAAARTARAALLAGVQAFLDGDYGRAVAALEGLDPPAGPTARALQLTVRAAARHALYRLGGERDATLLAAAIADVREARRTDPTFQPAAAAFSPRFRELFAGQR